MAKTFGELQALALQIRDEILEKKNTAPRVGAALLDMIDNTIQNITDINQKLSVFEHACSGFKRVESESQLPVTPPEDEKAVGYFVGKNLYLYVGKDGNAVNGRYFNVGDITGPQGEIGPQGRAGEKGEKGEQGNSGVSGSTDNIEVVNNLDGGESTPERIKVLAAEQGKVLNGKLSELDYRSGGSAIDVSMLESVLVEQVYPEIIEVEKLVNKLLHPTTGRLIDGTNETFLVNKYSISEFVKIQIKAQSFYNNCLWSIFDENGNLLDKKNSNNSGDYTEYDDIIRTPRNSALLYVAYKTTNTEYGHVLSLSYKNKNDEKIVSLEQQDERINDVINNITVERKNEISETEQHSSKLLHPTTGLIIDYEGHDSYKVNKYLIEENTKYNVSGSSFYNNCIWSIFDEHGNLLEKKNSNNEVNVTNYESDIITPKNAKILYVAFIDTNPSYGHTYSYMRVISSEKKWDDKKWAALGDSLTEENSATSKHYFDYISEKTGITVVNLGKGGTGYAKSSSKSTPFYDRVDEIPIDADVITIFGSFNDLQAGLSQGTITDTDTTTICGCINKTITAILDRFLDNGKLPRIGIITPNPWKNANPINNINGTIEDGTNYATKYVDALVEIAKRHSIPCLDLYRCANLAPWDERVRLLAYTKDTGQDGNPAGTHPDEVGHAILYPQILSFLETIL